MYCTKCGAQNLNQSNFCFKCGAPLEKGDEAIVQSGSENEFNEYRSPYENEEVVFSIRGRNRPEMRIFPQNKDQIPLLNSPDCDIFYTSKRICLTIGDANAKEPSPTKWFVPVGGGIGAFANLALQGAINGYRRSQFKKKHGDFYSAAEIDIMCMAGNAIYSVNPLRIDIFKEKPGFFNTIGNDIRYMNIAFTGEYQYQDRIIRGSIIHVFTGDVNDTALVLKGLSTASIQIANQYRNDAENSRYITSRL